jgi:hypothetical protein
MMKNARSIIVLVLLTAAGCGTSKITSVWKAPLLNPPAYDKILVLGLISAKDRSIQENMESHMAGDLNDLGYHAISSLQEYGPKAFDKMTETVALSKLKNSKVDAILTIVLLKKSRERQYVTPPVIYPPYASEYNRFWLYRSRLVGRIYEPGYYVTNTRYFWESNLYDMKTQQLLYSAQTESFDSSEPASLGHEYGQLIVKNMVKQGVLFHQKP